MKKNKPKHRNPYAKSLSSRLFRLRIVPNKKRKLKPFNWKQIKEGGLNPWRISEDLNHLLFTSTTPLHLRWSPFPS